MLMSVFALAGTTPPTAVLKSFQEKFPNAENVKWGMENKTEYEAEFKIETQAVSANFKEDGTWVETETVISLYDLPSSVIDYVGQNFSGITIKETAKIETPERTVFEVEIKGEAYLFDTAGKFIGEAEEK